MRCASQGASTTAPALLWQQGGIVPGEDTLIARLMARTGFATEIEARGGDALFEVQTAATSGQVREEYARSGPWLRQPWSQEW